MKNCLVDSASNLKLKSCGVLGVKFFKVFKGWPVSIAHEVIYKNGRDVPWGLHKKTAEFIYVLEGKAKACLGHKVYNVSSGDYLLIPPGVKHRFVTGKKPLIALSVFCPPMTWDNLDAVMCKDGKIKNKHAKKLKWFPK